MPRLFAVSDLHVGFPANRSIVEGIRPGSPHDWLLVAGDVGDVFGDVEWALSRLARRFARVVWAPGNHELWTPRDDPVQLRGAARYDALVAMCRRLGVVTPEDQYPVWRAPSGEPVRIAPLFLLYDYSFLPPGATTKAEALQHAYETGIVCSDEYLLHPDPYPTREAWCAERLSRTEARLAALDGATTVLVNHFPLTREATRILRYPQFAMWCGSRRTEDWHRRFRAAAVVYGHLHIPRTLWQDGVPFEEVSLGYPEEWRRRPPRPDPLTQILP